MPCGRGAVALAPPPNIAPNWLRYAPAGGCARRGRNPAPPFPTLPHRRHEPNWLRSAPAGGGLHRGRVGFVSRNRHILSIYLLSLLNHTTLRPKSPVKSTRHPIRESSLVDLFLPSDAIQGLSLFCLYRCKTTLLPSPHGRGPAGCCRRVRPRRKNFDHPIHPPHGKKALPSIRAVKNTGRGKGVRRPEGMRPVGRTPPARGKPAEVTEPIKKRGPGNVP